MGTNNNVIDYFAVYPLYLDEGYIFDGCGNSITVNQDSFMRNGVETFVRIVNNIVDKVVYLGCMVEILMKVLN